jgi:hypothetical protein
MWDKYFYDTTIHKILLHHPLTLADDADVDEFNRSAGEWALSLTKEEIVSNFIFSRSAMLKEFMIEMIRHDDHHMHQIEKAM